MHREGHTFPFTRSLVCVSPEKRGQAGSTEIGVVLIVEAWSLGSTLWFGENIQPSWGPGGEWGRILVLGREEQRLRKQRIPHLAENHLRLKASPGIPDKVLRALLSPFPDPRGWWGCSCCTWLTQLSSWLIHNWLTAKTRICLDVKTWEHLGPDNKTKEANKLMNPRNMKAFLPSFRRICPPNIVLFPLKYGGLGGDMC